MRQAHLKRLLQLAQEPGSKMQVIYTYQQREVDQMFTLALNDQIHIHDASSAGTMMRIIFSVVD